MSEWADWLAMCVNSAAFADEVNNTANRPSTGDADEPFTTWTYHVRFGH